MLFASRLTLPRLLRILLTKGLCHVTCAALMLLVSSAGAGLVDVKPRPQQMGMLAAAPVILDGALTLVMPDTPTPIEANVRNEIIAVLTGAMGIPPVVVPYSDWSGDEYSLWVGTPARFPALVDSLLASQIPGLGVLTHEEEYQLLIGEHNTFLAGYDQLGLQWGLFTLRKLMGEAFGQTTVDRAYVRDWPDFPKRICTVNSSVRIQSQYEYCDSLFNWAYSCKMDEIEWNDPDGGNEVRSDFAWTHALLLRQKLARRGQFLTFGTDLTALRVAEKSWQEGLPIVGMPMTIPSLNFAAASYGITVANGGFESFTGNVPNNWTMYPASSYALIARDAVQKHSGASSLCWPNMTADYGSDRTVHHRMHFGRNRMMRLRFWYRTSNFSGKIRLLVLGDDPVNNHFVNGRNSVPSTTGWTEFVGDFSTCNVDTASLWIGPEEYSSGTLWIDDISIENVGPLNMLRRPDTPVRVYKQPGQILMTENVDYFISETSPNSYTNYIASPRFTRISGGALSAGSQVTVDWSTALLFQGGRETVCWSMLEPLAHYQRQIRALDSTLAPDGIKIHINEVTLAGYDQNCLSRGMTPGQLVGSHVNQLYQIVQGRRPGMPVRSYGDPFDVWVKDNRCHPVTTSPWTIGALQQTSPLLEMMVMTDYSMNMDSSFRYFNNNGHSAVLAYVGDNPFRKAVDGAAAARRAANCTGFSIYSWSLGSYQSMLDLSSLGWNFGPFYLHNPPRYSARPDTVFISAEMWTDSFGLSDPISLTAKYLVYRFLPGGNWTTVTPTLYGQRTYRSALVPPVNATSIEYYFSATDHRSQTRRLPPDAPSKVFSSFLPESNPNSELDPRVNNTAIVPVVNGRLIEWPEVEGAKGYEVHWMEQLDLSRRNQTIVANVPSGQTQFYLDPAIFRDLSVSQLVVLPIRSENIGTAKTVPKK